MMNIPFNKPHAHGPELQYIRDAISRAHLSGDGYYTKKCHEYLESVTGAKKALLTQSGTAALEMAALLIDCGPGDEIIMPSYTFVSTANAFVLRGAKPVFTDIRPDTKNMNETLIEAAVTERTKAICVVHYAGVACEMDAIMDIARRHGLYVIEDAAQGFGAAYKGRPLGSIGHLGCYSFHETKNVISGEGGALLINDEAFIERAEIIREKGTNRSRFFRGQVDKYTWVDIGSSYLPSEITAAYLYGQLYYGDVINAERMRLWNMYHAALEPLEEQGLLKRPCIPAECSHNAHMYYIQLPSCVERNELIEKLAAADIKAVFHYIPLHSAPAGLKYGRTPAPMPHTDNTADTLVRLPLFYDLGESGVSRVLEAAFGILPKRSHPRLQLVDVADVSRELQWQLRDWRNSKEISEHFLLDYVTEEQHERWLQRNIRGVDALAYVIFADETPIGLVYFPWMKRDCGLAEIGIYVKVHGYGALRPADFAYSQMFDIARRYGMTHLSARILTDNYKSIRLHERMGFVPLVRDTIPIEKNGEYMCAVKYEKTL